MGGTLDRQERHQSQDPFIDARAHMVAVQIERRGVKDEKVLEAMRKVPRHLFVPKRVRSSAYDDTPLAIGYGQTISQPYIVGLMTECLDLQGGEKILEVGTGSGYQAAILAEIADSVFTIEIIEQLSARADKLFRDMNYDNVYVRHGDGYQGWEEQAPFDGIIVTAAPGHIPQPLIEQLKVGGRMIIPVGDWYQELILLKKKSRKKIVKESVIPVRFVPMTGQAQKKK
jgi:protein-L-isoaspartate(D-aspartate) O-methyltransferase